MPAPRRIRPARALTTHLDEELLAKVDLLLVDDVEGKVPKGAYQRLFTTLLQRMFEEEEMDIGPELNQPFGIYKIRATPATLAALRQRLKG